MALFNKQYIVPQPVHVQYMPVRVVRENLHPSIPKLPVFCTRHGLPVPMRYSGPSYSASGHPVGNFRCPISTCTCTEGYGLDHHTHQPRRIFAKG